MYAYNNLLCVREIIINKIKWKRRGKEKKTIKKKTQVETSRKKLIQVVLRVINERNNKIK